MYVTHLYIFLNVKINNISFTLFFVHFFLATRNENRKKWVENRHYYYGEARFSWIIEAKCFHRKIHFHIDETNEQQREREREKNRFLLFSTHVKFEWLLSCCRYTVTMGRTAAE